jgi:D-alanyl-D-alanine carboxypeptidase (penicillin-binding protein 5/6)
VIFVITGLDSEKARAEESQAVVNWAFRQFVSRILAKAGTRVAEAEVFMGTEAMVGLVPAADVTALVPAQVQEGVTAEVVYNGPLMAPVEAGTAVAELIVHIPGLPDLRAPLVAETAVARGGFVTRLGTAAAALRARVMGDAAPAS